MRNRVDVWWMWRANFETGVAERVQVKQSIRAGSAWRALAGKWRGPEGRVGVDFFDTEREAEEALSAPHKKGEGREEL